MKIMILVSACLVGVNCRYDGKNSCIETIKKLVDQGQALPVCPEVLGGLPTPRPKAEIRPLIHQVKVINEKGYDVTKAFNTGADKTLAIAKKYGATVAVLKSKSPSCGCHQIYDGTFSGSLIKGSGLTAELLKHNGIKVMNEKEFMKWQERGQE